MKNLIQELKKYLKEILGIEIPIRSWKEQKQLPFFLLDHYIFFETTLINHPCLFMISKNDVELTPNTIQKHWEQIEKKLHIHCVYVSKAISSYNRKRLIQYHLPFIIPNNQIYLPDLGIDLREHFKQQRIPKQFFSPATQIVIISALLGEKKDRFTPSELATKLQYSPMTMTRVFNELETAGIGEFINRGKERRWIFEDKKSLWEQTKEMLRSPIRNRESLILWPKRQMPKLPLSGISALAETTMINPPFLPTYAMGIEEYKETNKPKGFQLSPADEADFELEIWNYDPKLTSEQGRIDLFSLYLSLREAKDERIEAALEQLMNEVLDDKVTLPISVKNDLSEFFKQIQNHPVI